MELINDKRYLIINADDFGMSHSSNAAIAELFSLGLITSASLMACCPWFEEAAIICRENPQYDVGLHLTFTSEWDSYRWGSLSGCKSLRDVTGRMFKSCEEFENTAKPSDVLIEMTYQLEKCKGINITNLDNHMGSLFGLKTGVDFMQQAIAFAAQHKLPYRMPKSFPKEYTAILPTHVVEEFKQLVTFGESIGVRFIDHLVSYPFEMTDGESYESFKEMFIQLIRDTQVGISEIYLHPCIDCEELRSMHSNWQKRVWEYMVLKDVDVRNAIQEEGIILIGWKDV